MDEHQPTGRVKPKILHIVIRTFSHKDKEDTPRLQKLSALGTKIGFGTNERSKLRVGVRSSRLYSEVNTQHRDLSVKETTLKSLVAKRKLTLKTKQLQAQPRGQKSTQKTFISRQFSQPIRIQNCQDFLLNQVISS